MTEKKRKVFCLGLLCKKSSRRHSCVDCGIYVCRGVCSVGNKNNIRCVDCYLEFWTEKTNTHIEEWKKAVNP